MATPDAFLNKRVRNILGRLSDLNQRLGVGQYSSGEQYSTTSGVRRDHQKVFVVGLIPPDRLADYVAVKVKTTPLNVTKQDRKFQLKNGKGVMNDPLDNVRRLSNKDWDAISAAARAAGMSPKDLVAVMIASSGMDPSAENPRDSRVRSGGLIQMTDGQLAAMSTGAGTTRIPATGEGGLSFYGVQGQMPIIQNFYSLQAPESGKYADLADVVTATLGRTPTPSEFAAFENATRTPAYAEASQRLDMRASGESVTAGSSQMFGPGKNRDIRTAGSVDFGLNDQIVTSSGRMNAGPDVTEGAKSPISQIGGDVQANTNRQKLFVQKQVDELNDQITAMQELPTLVMIVNPSSLKRHYEHTVDYPKGRRKVIVSAWLEKPGTISGDGQTSVQYAMKADGAGGLTGANRIHSLSYENLMSLAGIYRNNGAIFTHGFSTGNRGVPLVAASAFIYHDGFMYVGSFDDFGIGDKTDKPHNLSYNFNFTVRYEIPVEGVSIA